MSAVSRADVREAQEQVDDLVSLVILRKGQVTAAKNALRLARIELAKAKVALLEAKRKATKP